MSSISIKDVAAEADVSVATVSRVINKKGVCSPAAEQAVTRAIEKLGYRPNLFGKALRRSETKIIMVLLSSLANTFCSRVIHSIDRAASKNGYNIMICATEGNPDRERYYINFAANRLFDGIIILNSSMSAAEMSALSASIPTVQCNEFVDTNTTPYVTINNKAAAYDAVSMLIKHGRRRIVFFTVNNDLISTKERFSGYKTALSDNNIALCDELILYGNYGYRNAASVFGAFADSGIPFDAVFAISDRMAVGAAGALTGRGVKIPEQVEIIGFDNTDISYISTPKLTTVAQPHKELGENAFIQLKNLITGTPASNIILPHRIVERSSTFRSGK